MPKRASGNIGSDQIRADDRQGESLVIQMTDGVFVPGNVPKYGADGGLVDSGKKASDIGTGGGGTGGGKPIIDGLATWYDPAPAITHSEDDEFNSTVLDPKWAVFTNTAASVDIDTALRSHLRVMFNGSGQAYRIWQPYAGVGDTSLTACTRLWKVATSQIAIWFRTSDSQNGMGISHNSWDGFNLYSLDAGASNIRAGLAGGGSKQYIHLQRVSGVWSGWTSGDGISWARLGTYTKAFTIGGIWLQIDGGPTLVIHACDWIRRDWLYL